VVVQGQHFLPGTTVSVGGTAITPTSMSPTQMLLQMPPGVPGAVQVVISSPQGCPTSFTYTYY
jgi:hypothetical protein